MEPLKHGKYYHIYNRGINREDLFRQTNDYKHFLWLYEKYVSPVADTFAWVLMKNHFHLLVRIKDAGEIGAYKLSNADRSMDDGRFKEEKWETIPNLSISAAINLSASPRPDSVNVGNSKIPNPTLHFSHLFNAYSKYINKMYNRSGSLFERPFRRKQVYSNGYFRHMVVYIHHNAEHHGFTDNYKDYPWSSYGGILSVKPTRLSREKVIGWFDGAANFVAMHGQKIDSELIKEILIE